MAIEPTRFNEQIFIDLAMECFNIPLEMAELLDHSDCNFVYKCNYLDGEVSEYLALYAKIGEGEIRLGEEHLIEECKKEYERLLSLSDIVE